MLTEIAAGVHVHESAFLQTNTVVVQGHSGVLVIDPGITEGELTGLADELRSLGRPVVAGFSTHPHWDHVLWHPALGDANRYGTAACVDTIREQLTQPDWQQDVAEGLPPEHATEIPMALFGQLTALPVGATRLPWDGPTVRVLEHRAHAPGHAALLIEEPGVLVAGDLVSDILMPFLDLQAPEPIEDYLDGLQLLVPTVDQVTAVVPGHGSVGTAEQLRSRIARDRAYVEALRDGAVVDDERVGVDAPLPWLPDVHRWQQQRLGARSGPDSTEP